ncbi:uncharacterized protein LOC141617200 [Silene latifolia]|uniref:uncharacterized protein LOC141617200 n=1 Tax=Silene latifolia TaxID=37657 RepID=UPI003D77EF75
MPNSASPDNPVANNAHYALYDDPLYITPADQHTNNIVDVLFNGSDFMNWKREVMLALMAKNKDSFITGTCAIPDSPLKKDLGDISQDNTIVVDYYSRLKRTWEDIDAYCKKVEKQKAISDSVGGLTEGNAYASIKHPSAQLDSAAKKPKIDADSKPFKQCSHCQKKGHKVTECYQLQTCPLCNVFGHVDFQCYLARGYGRGRPQGQEASGSASRDRGHSNSYHRKGNNMYKRPASNNANAVRFANEDYEDMTPFDDDEHHYYTVDNVHGQTDQQVFGSADMVAGLVDKVVQKVMKALFDNTAQSNASYTMPSTSFAGITSVSPIFHQHNNTHSDVWIVDSGASDHLTSCISLVHDIKTLRRPILVGLPDGSTELVYKTGTDHLSKLIVAKRLGHSSFDKMRHLPDFYFPISDKHSCEVCILSKHHKLPFNTSQSHATTCFALIHLDVWGPYRVRAHSRATSFLTIVDDYTRTTWTFLIQSTEQVPHLVKDFLIRVENQFNAKVKIIRTDHGTEFVQGPCKAIFNDRGIIHHKSVVGRPQQNDRVERKYRHFLEIARALRIQANLPLKFWGDCVLTATYLINKMPTPILKWKTPFEMLF